MAANTNRLNTGALYSDASTIEGFHGTTLPYPGTLGHFYESNGKKFQLVKLDSTGIQGVVGHAVAWLDFDDFTVTNDISESSINFPAGVLASAAAVGEYCFIQVRGPVTVKTDGGDDITAGDMLILDPTTDGTVDSVTAAATGAIVPLGFATASDVDTLDTVAAILTVTLNGA